MRGKMSLVLALGMALAVSTVPGDGRATRAADDKKEEMGTPLAHNVFFTLNERTAANRKALVAACKKYLTKHEGVLYFTVGTVCEDLKREVNDLDFDVALTIVFKDKAAHDKYQDHKRHLAFIKENKGLWKKVRVFDSYNPK